MKNLLIVRAPFREIFMPEVTQQLSEQYNVYELLNIEDKKYNNKVLKYYHKIINLIYIHILRSRKYHQILSEKRIERYYDRCISKIDTIKFDSILSFRGDRIPIKSLKKLNRQTENMITYLFDSIDMCPKIWSKKKYFKTIYCFDKDDIKKHSELNLKLTTNFYFELYEPIKKQEKYDLYYLGVGLDERKKTLQLLTNLITTKNNLFITDHKITYLQNLENVNNSRCIIDIKLPIHNGLSFRFFESLSQEKKIITNNSTVVNFDFYHPNNILIVDYSDLDVKNVESFLSKPYEPIPQNIKEKYSLKYWLKNILT